MPPARQYSEEEVTWIESKLQPNTVAVVSKDMMDEFNNKFIKDLTKNKTDKKSISIPTLQAKMNNVAKNLNGGTLTITQPNSFLDTRRSISGLVHYPVEPENEEPNLENEDIETTSFTSASSLSRGSVSMRSTARPVKENLFPYSSPAKSCKRSRETKANSSQSRILSHDIVSNDVSPDMIYTDKKDLAVGTPYFFFDVEKLSIPYPYIFNFQDRTILVFQLPVYGWHLVHAKFGTVKGVRSFGIRYHMILPTRDDIKDVSTVDDGENFLVNKDRIMTPFQTIVVPLSPKLDFNCYDSETTNTTATFTLYHVNNLVDDII